MPFKDNLDQSKLKSALVKKYEPYTQYVELVFDAIAKTGFVGYQTREALDLDIGIRACTLTAISSINEDQIFQYPNSAQSFGTPSRLWESRPLKIVKKKGLCATEALDDLFEKGAHLDCERAADACVIRGIDLAFRCNQWADIFNDLFEAFPLELKHKGWHQHSNSDLSYLPSQFIELTQTSLLPGDRRYFANCPSYILYDPKGIASGMHTIYIKDGIYDAMDWEEGPLDQENIINFFASHYDENHSFFQNVLYEQWKLDDFKPWREFSIHHFSAIKEECLSDVEAYCNKVRIENPLFSLTAANIDEHLPHLHAFRHQSVLKRIAEANKVKMCNRIRRIDVARLLLMVRTRLKTPRSANHGNFFTRRQGVRSAGFSSHKKHRI